MHEIFELQAPDASISILTKFCYIQIMRFLRDIKEHSYDIKTVVPNSQPRANCMGVMSEKKLALSSTVSLAPSLTHIRTL